MSSYGGEMNYDDQMCPMTEMLEWLPYFDKLCKLIGLKFNNFLLSLYQNDFSGEHNINSNSKGWTNQITPLAILMLGKESHLMFSEKL